jgi:hypothetical protein
MVKKLTKEDIEKNLLKLEQKRVKDKWVQSDVKKYMALLEVWVAIYHEG